MDYLRNPCRTNRNSRKCLGQSILSASRTCHRIPRAKRFRQWKTVKSPCSSRGNEAFCVFFPTNKIWIVNRLDFNLNMSSTESLNLNFELSIKWISINEEIGCWRNSLALLYRNSYNVSLYSKVNYVQFRDNETVGQVIS